MLADELIDYVFGFCDFEILLSVLSISKKWKKIAESNNVSRYGLSDISLNIRPFSKQKSVEYKWHKFIEYGKDIAMCDPYKYIYRNVDDCEENSKIEAIEYNKQVDFDRQKEINDTEQFKLDNGIKIIRLNNISNFIIANDNMHVVSMLHKCIGVIEIYSGKIIYTFESELDSNPIGDIKYPYIVISNITKDQQPIIEFRNIKDNTIIIKGVDFEINNIKIDNMVYVIQKNLLIVFNFDGEILKKVQFANYLNDRHYLIDTNYEYLYNPDGKIEYSLQKLVSTELLKDIATKCLNGDNIKIYLYKKFDIILIACQKDLSAYSIIDGKKLWSKTYSFFEIAYHANPIYPYVCILYTTSDYGGYITCVYDVCTGLELYKDFDSWHEAGFNDGSYKLIFTYSGYYSTMDCINLANFKHVYMSCTLANISDGKMICFDSMGSNKLIIFDFV